MTIQERLAAELGGTIKTPQDVILETSAVSKAVAEMGAQLATVLHATSAEKIDDFCVVGAERTSDEELSKIFRNHYEEEGATVTGRIGNSGDPLIIHKDGSRYARVSANYGAMLHVTISRA